MFKLRIDYPSRDEERVIVQRMAHPELDLKAISVAKLADIETARSWVDKIYIDEKIVEYILDITIATRPAHHNQLSARQSGAQLDKLKELIEYGASPRAAIALVVAAKAMAFISGRAYVVTAGY